MSHLKQQFPYFSHHPERIYLDSAATAHKPREVIQAICDFYEKEYGTVHRAIYRASLKATDMYNEARQEVCSFLCAQCPEEIVFTKGTSDSLNLVATSFGRAILGPEDEILVSSMEHHSNLVPWQMLAKQTGATLRWIPMTKEGTLDWEETITSKTKIVALAHASNVTGTIHPIAAIANKVHQMGGYLVVDGAQGAPHLKVDVQALRCDFYAFSGHKCYGPTGIGVLYGKKELLEKMEPLQGGGDMIEEVSFAKTSYQEPPLRFEAGTPHIAGVIGLKAALRFLAALGSDLIEEHGKTLLYKAKEQLSTIPSLVFLPSGPESVPLLSFHIPRIHPLDMTTLLDLKNIAIRSGHLCAQPLLGLFGLTSVGRASFGLYNTEEEIDRFAKDLAEVASNIGISRQ